MSFHWTLLLCVWIVTAKVDSIEVTPKSLFVAPRGQTTLTCSGSTGSFEWLRGQLGNLTKIGDNINNDARDVLSTDSSQLNITGFSEEDQCGNYYCLDAYTLSCPATVSLADISSDFEMEPSDTQGQEGKDFVLFCRPPVSHPPAMVNWIKDGHAFSPNSSHVIGPCGLVILNASMEDAGIYQCVASNPVTMEQVFSRGAHFNFTAQGSGLETPFIMVAPPISTVMEGSSVTLQCVVSSPGCAVSWAGLQGSLPSSPGGVLTLENISPSDEGQYNCTSVCDTIVLSAMATVFVQVLPKVTIQPNDMVVAMPEGSTLNCTVTGKGLIQLYWLQSDMLLATEERTVESSLTLLYAVNKSGFYQCMAVTSHACDHSEIYVMIPSTATPTATMPTTATPTTPPSVSVHPSSTVSIALGDSVELVCTGVGDQLPSLFWINAAHPNLPLPVAHSGFNASMAWVSIVVNSNGTYQCLAIHSSMSSSAFVTVTVQVPSITVTAHALDEKEGGVVNISCIVSGCGAQRTVEWTKGLLPLPSTTQGDVTTLSLGPISLAEAGTYTCSVQCSNGFKITDQVVVKVTTMQPPPHPPGHVTAIWTNGAIQVTWDAPPHPAYLSPIIGYKLNWKEGDGPLPQSGLTSVPASVHSIPIATTNPLASYTVAVWAYSIAGDGPVGVATLPPLVTDPYVITSCDSSSSDAANIQWKAFVAVNKNTRLMYECSLAQVVHVVGVASEGVAHLTQLLPNCSYNVWLQVDETDVSNCSFTTHPGPLNITVTALSGAVQLHWMLPQGAKVELFIEDHWVDVTLGGAVTSIWNLHDMLVKVTLGNWTVTSVITVPTDTPNYSTSSGGGTPTPVMTATGADGDVSKQVGLLYGVIFGGLLVACATALILILTLKYVQMSRMKQDKEIGIKDERKKQTEAFRRMSLSRSSSSSLGKTPPPPYTTVVQVGAPDAPPTTCIGYRGEARGSVTTDTTSRHSTLTNSSLKLTPPPGDCSTPWQSTPPPGSDHSSRTSDDAGSVGVVTYTIVTTRKPRKGAVVTDI